MEHSSPKFIAVIEDVREVALTGLVDASCWKPAVRGADLQLASHNGRAEVRLTAIEARYMGVPFCELSVCVYVRHPEIDESGNCLFLTYAFHSSRLFAWIERAVFRTPYHRARIQVDAELPVSFGTSDRQGSLLAASMDPHDGASREPIRSGYETWQGPIFLPASAAADARLPGRRKWFAARLAGDTHAYPFLPGLDELTIRPSPRHPVLQRLADSHFAGREWTIRESAMHARSRTFAESPALDIAAAEVPST